MAALPQTGTNVRPASPSVVAHEVSKPNVPQPAIDSALAQSSLAGASGDTFSCPPPNTKLVNPATRIQ